VGLEQAQGAVLAGAGGGESAAEEQVAVDGELVGVAERLRRWGLDPDGKIRGMSWTSLADP
jgi:hypothetical protein